MSQNIWSPTDPARERRRRWWIIALILGAVFVLIISGFLAYRNNIASPTTVLTPAVTPTTVQKDEVSTLLTLNPAMLYQTVLSQKPALQDPLDGSNAQAWDLYSQNGGGCLFERQALHVFVTDHAPVDLAVCFLRNEFLTNFAAQFQITLGSATMNNEARNAGLIFRFNLMHQVGYSCDIYSNSYLTLTESELQFNLTQPDGTPVNLRSSSSTLLDNINSPHLLTVIALRDHITIYINGQPLIEMTDATFQAGQLGVYAFLVPTPGVVTFPRFDDLFQNLKLWTFQ